jgi:hypothetical protein
MISKTTYHGQKFETGNRRPKIEVKGGVKVREN